MVRGEEMEDRSTEEYEEDKRTETEEQDAAVDNDHVISLTDLTMSMS